MPFSKSALVIDPATETERIVHQLQESVRRTLRKSGAVVGISGGVDSAVVFSLCLRAFGPNRVIAIMMPDQDSDPLSERLAQKLTQDTCVTPLREEITPVLEGFQCYQRRDEAIRRVVPEYDEAKGWTAKIVLPSNLLEENTLNVFSVTVISPDGQERTEPLPMRDYLQIVAASNFKQRTRMATLYYHAELNNYAVIGTPNKNERDQGFFVKYGDSGADINAIAHLYKTQVYQLAEYLDVPREIRERPPTTDTYSAPCTQEEFFFRLPFETMDLLWHAQEQNTPVPEVARVMEMSEAQVQHAFDDFSRKWHNTSYLRLPPLNMEPKLRQEN